ncbi:MAG: TlpA disulfide reductase family protein [bacterium]|nr:TlpA disulfide reductase family protein [bacterium]
MTGARRMTGIVTARAAVAAAAALSLSWAHAAERKAGVHLIGKPAPGFVAAAVDGSTQSLSRHRGKVVLLDFWSTWCGPCRKEMPSIKRIRERHPASDLVVIGVSLDRDKREMREYMEEAGIDWPVLFDGRGWNNKVAAQYRVRQIPFTVLVDREGIVREVDLRGRALEEAVASLLSPPAPAAAESTH